MGRGRNEDAGLHRLELSNWKGRAAVWAFGQRWTFGKWDEKKDRPTREAEAKFLRQLSFWAISPAKRLRESEQLLIELWADWRSSNRAPANRLDEFGRVESVLFGTVEAPGPHFATRVSEFGSPELEAWQNYLCGLRTSAGEPRLGRYSVSRYVGLVRMCISWGVVVGKVERGQAEELRLVTPPAFGAVKEPVPRGSVEWDEVERVAKQLKSDVGPLLKVLWWTGARPSELCGLTVGMLRRGGKIHSTKGAEVDLDKYGVWAARLEKHKNSRRGKERVLFFGRESQRVMEALILRRGPVFQTSTGGHYSSKQIRDYVKKCCENNDWPVFSPYQIDHAFLCRVQAAFSSEIAGSGPIAAKAARGHSMRGITESYTGADLVTAAMVAAKCG
jgi:integrase